MDIYPNPTNGIFHIDANISEYELILYQGGRAVETSYGSKVVDLSAYPNGVYQVKLISDREVWVKQIIKVK